MSIADDIARIQLDQSMQGTPQQDFFSSGLIPYLNQRPGMFHQALDYWTPQLLQSLGPNLPETISQMQQGIYQPPTSERIWEDPFMQALMPSNLGIVGSLGKGIGKMQSIPSKVSQTENPILNPSLESDIIESMAKKPGKGDITTGTTPTPEGGIQVKPFMAEQRGDTEYWRLPVELKVDENHLGYPTVNILPGGHVQVIWQGWGMQNHELQNHVRDAIEDYFQKARRSLMKEDNVFWRFTDNKKEIELLKLGEINKSLNHATGYRESGISVSTTPAYTMMGYKYGYKVEGKQIGIGSDGEPILDASTIKPISKIRTAESIDNEYLPKLRSSLDEVLKDNGWNKKQYDAATSTVEFIPSDKFLQNENVNPSFSPSSSPTGGERSSIPSLISLMMEGD